MGRLARAILAAGCSAVLLASLVTGAALASGTSSSAAKSATALLDLGVLQQLNQIRAAHGLARLTLSPELSAAARMHSRDMVAKGYFAHNSSNGSPFWKRIEAYYPEGRAGYWSVGENLFWTAGDATAPASMKAWMASPEHRANILNPAWRQIGIGAVSSPDAPGAFADLGVTVITTDFGVRR